MIASPVIPSNDVISISQGIDFFPSRLSVIDHCASADGIGSVL